MGIQTYDEILHSEHNLGTLSKSAAEKYDPQVPNLDSQEHFPNLSGPKDIPKSELDKTNRRRKPRLH